jgi:hypothetical protein
MPRLAASTRQHCSLRVYRRFARRLERGATPANSPVQSLIFIAFFTRRSRTRFALRNFYSPSRRIEMPATPGKQKTAALSKQLFFTFRPAHRASRTVNFRAPISIRCSRSVCLPLLTLLK